MRLPIGAILVALIGIINAADIFDHAIINFWISFVVGGIALGIWFLLDDLWGFVGPLWAVTLFVACGGAGIQCTAAEQQQ